MDTAALIGSAALRAKLKRVRFESIEARRFPKMANSGGGGHLRTATTVAFSKQAKGECLSIISLKVEGFPKEVDMSTATEDQRAFAIEVVVRGVYAWEELPPAAVLEDAELARLLGRAIYVRAATEVEMLADKLGVGGVALDPDIPARNDKESVPLTAAQKLVLMQQIDGKSDKRQTLGLAAKKASRKSRSR
jgi:hypothetical protein